jgi:hypothetical protein
VIPNTVVRLEGLSKLKILNDLIGTRTRHLPACSLAPQPSTLRRVPAQSIFSLRSISIVSHLLLGVSALSYKPEGRRFETNRNEYEKQEYVDVLGD